MQRKIRCPSRGEKGSALVVALFLMIILSLLGSALLTLSGTEHNIAYNTVWVEGAFDAAEAGIQTELSSLSASQDTAVAVPETNIVNGVFTYSFWSGTLADRALPTKPAYQGERIESGYSFAIGSVYNPSGYVFYSYQIDATGTGPRNAQRQLQTLAEYGPVPK